MRDLLQFELEVVSGAGGSPMPPCGCYCPPSKSPKTKNHNGYGNGAESGPAPGNSGATGGGKNQNFGPRGARYAAHAHRPDRGPRKFPRPIFFGWTPSQGKAPAVAGRGSLASPDGDYLALAPLADPPPTPRS